MYFPTTRVLTVLEILQSRQQMSGQELAKRLEVDPRTVRRYITMLQDLGIPIEGTRGRYGAYRLRPGFKLPPLMFHDDEALALTVGLLVSQKMGVTLDTLAVESALAKIERVMPPALRERIQGVQETLVVDVIHANATPRSELVLALSEAARQRRSVQMYYRAYEGQETERKLDPYGLVYRSGYWYVVGYCHLRLDLRSFRLDRILRIETEENGFVRPDNFDCLAFVLKSLPNTPATWYVEIFLETTLKEAQQLVPPALALLEQVGDDVVLKCYVEDLDWVAWILIRLHCPFVVRRPTELKVELLKLAQQLIALAERT